MSGPGGGFAGTGVGGGGPGASCSPDGHAVTDAQGHVVKQCPKDEGCHNGACVAACLAESAKIGSIGCDFLAADPPFYENGSPGNTYAGACYALFVSNTWTANAHITVSRNGQTFDVTQFGYIPSGNAPNITYTPLDSSGLPPDQVAILFLSHNPNAMHTLGFPLSCPKSPALAMDAAVTGTGMGSAFHISSDQPIVAYDILPYGGATSFLPAASLLFPTTAWGSNYVVFGPHPEGGGELFLTIIGSKDGTTVTLNPKQTLPGGGGLAPATAGTPNTFTIGAGQTLQWIGAADPSAAVLSSTAPVGVVTGSTYLRVATANMTSGGGEDSAHQQIPHVNALGNEYVGPGVVTRVASMAPESVLYRIVGVVDGTQLTYDPPGIPGPSTLNQGQIAEFMTPAVFTVTSQATDHPFGFTHYLAGADQQTRPGCAPTPPFAGLTCGLGDEEWVNLLAPAQFRNHYSFFTDPTYATTNLVITRVADGSGAFSDVTIDCLGAPVSGWMPVGSGGKYQVAYVDLARGTVPVVPACGSSRHLADSKGDFGIVVWGTDYYASYGYAAGGNLTSVNHVIVPPS
jgi:hypothetical protein